MNELLFLFHTFIIAVSLLVALRLGKEALITFMSIGIILANLFVIKPITLFGFTATGADAFIIGSVLSLQLLQEYFGKKIAQKAIWISFAALVFYTIMTQIHLTYLPHLIDVTQPHFHAVLAVMPRITIASFTSYFISQQFDYFLYGALKKILNGRYLIARNYASAASSQLLDTVLFSFLGLYGIVGNIFQIILVSYSIKLICLLMISPSLALAKRAINSK